MARLRFTLCSTAEVALTTSLKTVAHLRAAANTRVAIRGFGVSFDGVSSTAGGAEVILAIQSSSGTFSNGSLSKEVRGSTEALSSTGSVNFTAEPTVTDYLRTYNINPMTGYERAFAQDEEIELSGGVGLGIMVRASSAVNCFPFINAEE